MRHFRKDMLAALTVAIVALPLSMAIAVASGVSPERGLYTAIIGGFLVSALGGSRYQIGGPAGAFIVLVAATVAKFGLEGLLLTVFISGLMLTLIGLLRLGSLIRYIPHAVTVGFTCGIAVTIFASQLKDLGGLKLAARRARTAVAQAGRARSGAADAQSGGARGRRWLGRPDLPAAALAAELAGNADRGRRWPRSPRWLFHLPVETIGSRFGQLPHGLPVPHLPTISLALCSQVLPAALSFTLLGGVESLLSAKVADGMTGRKHRYNMEVVAQGIANIASAMFGGISVTGTIARTATNIRAGACSPVSGMMHALFVLVFMVVAAPLASFVPLSALAGVLVVVCWNMAEKEEFPAPASRLARRCVLIATFGLTLIEDLTVGIIAGCVLAAVFAVFDRIRQRRASP